MMSIIRCRCLCTISLNAAALYERITEIATAKQLGGDELFAGLSKYVRQLTGPLISILREASASVAYFALARQPEQRLLNLMEVMYQHDGKHLYDARGDHQRNQAADAMMAFIGKITDTDTQQWRASGELAAAYFEEHNRN